MTPTILEPEIDYPDSDGKPVADNDRQWHWMETIVGEARHLYGLQAYVAGNLFWYPKKGNPNIVTAPDAMIAFGRPAGDRRSYKQWEEDGIAPQVVFEILSESNTQDDIDDTFEFYDEHGVEEYYLIDPRRQTVTAYHRRKGRLRQIMDPYAITSPRLGIRFEIIDGQLAIIGPDGVRWVRRAERELELRERIAAEMEQAADERRRAEREKQRAEQEKARAEQEKARAESFLAKLQAAGIDPNS
jgi:hypothetical protein